MRKLGKKRERLFYSAAGLILIAFGVMLLVDAAFGFPLVTLIVDDTPPAFTETMPADGETYSPFGTVYAKVDDSESGVKSVTYTMLGKTYILKPVTGGWSYALPYEDIEVLKMKKNQWIDFQFVATNYAGLSKTVSGKFMIYEAIKGVWYINGQKVTSSSQTIYSTTRTVKFKFQRTAGNPVNVWVEEGGAKILTLSKTATYVWEGSKTFTPGAHTLKLRASDSVMTCTLMVLNIEVPGAVDPKTLKTLFAAAMIIGGAALLLRGKR